MYNRSIKSCNISLALIIPLFFSGKLSKSIDDLTRIGKAFENYLTSEVSTQIPLGSRRMNDIKMGIDKIMASPDDLK
jgi:hypothetical protein